MRFTKYWNQLKWLREILETLGDWDWMIVKYRPKEKLWTIEAVFLTTYARLSWNVKW